ncbi:cytochrome C [Geotalea sp. SG265]|uniref:cytochrome C n=1 Tax=Geotalea sp. SG265 TaxID=2922867 RepID=UPI001FAFBF64|nr:cytochrome C [Geotalea sp. SG265]
MQRISLTSFIVVSALLAYPLPGNIAFAFHNGGVADCDGCHTMHNSSGNVPMTTGGRPTGAGYAYLLKGSDQSSTCLICHAGSSPTDSFKVATNPVPAPGNFPLQLPPGGDFAYLQKNYNWVTSTGTAQSSPGSNHGHNINAADFLYFSNGARWTTAPGGFYPTASLGCTSCHDPHGKYRILDAAGTTIATTGKPIGDSGSYGALPTSSVAVGSYRLLAGQYYKPASLQGNFGFVANPPVAVAPQSYNRSEAASDTRVAYGMGMSEWCGNCHASLQHNTINPATTVGNHPAGYNAKLTNVYTTYNAYIYTGNLTNTNPALGYSSLVPFEESISSLSSLAADTTSTAGASAVDNVNCLTCHRAHASAWDSCTRWNTAQGAYLTVAGSYPGLDAPTTQGQQGEYATGKTMAEYQQAMYDRPPTAFAANQWSLCNKCHEQDQHKQ